MPARPTLAPLVDERPLTFAVPKGRLLRSASKLLTAAGVLVPDLDDGDDRRLVRTSADGAWRFLVLRNSDVPTYVERGICELGIVGREVLLEQGADLYEPLDLGVGRCRLVVAGPEGSEGRADGLTHLRVGTKYPNLAHRHFLARGLNVELITLSGSVELAPLVGLSDWIVDLTESGETLRQNGLVIHEDVLESSARLVVNRAAMKLRAPAVRALVASLGAVLAAQAAAATPRAARPRAPARERTPRGSTRRVRAGATR